MGALLLYFAAVIIEDCLNQEPEQVCDLINNFFEQEGIKAQAIIETVFNRNEDFGNPKFFNPKKAILITFSDNQDIVNILNYLASNNLGKITIAKTGISNDNTSNEIKNEDIEQTLEAYKNLDINTKFDSYGNRLDLEIILTQ